MTMVPPKAPRPEPVTALGTRDLAAKAPALTLEPVKALTLEPVKALAMVAPMPARPMPMHTRLKLQRS